MKYLEKKHEIISYIYQLRVLSYYEIFEKFFEPYNLSDHYCRRIIGEMVTDNFLEKRGFRKNDSYYFVTTKGINIIKERGVKLVGSSDTDSDPYLLPANKLKINDNLLKHQTSLNHFVLEYEKQKDFEYYDEKYVSKVFPGARPDGLIKEDGRILFLEMDMNTERKNALNKKWENYRKLFRSDSFYNIEEDVVIVFILGGELVKAEKRKSFLRKQIELYIGDYIGPKINVLIDTEENLLNILKDNNKALITNALSKLGYSIYLGSVKDNSFYNYEFNYYIKTSDKNNLITTYDDVTDEYTVDDMTDGNQYTFKKILNYGSIQSKFDFIHHRDLKYIVVVNSDTEAFNVAKDSECFNNFIYYTTIQRLNTRPLYEALFQFNSNGEKWHFDGPNLKIKIKEDNIKA